MYKKIVVICTLVIMLVGMVGCSRKDQSKDGETAVEKSIMTTDFYQGVCSIELAGSNIIIEDKAIIEEIKNDILSLEITKSDKNISDYYGNTVLTFNYDDGSSKTVTMTSKFIYDLGETYYTNKDICTPIRQKFD